MFPSTTTSWGTHITWKNGRLVGHSGGATDLGAFINHHDERNVDIFLQHGCSGSQMTQMRFLQIYHGGDRWWWQLEGLSPRPLPVTWQLNEERNIFKFWLNVGKDIPF